MKHIFYSLLIAVSLFSCKSNTKQDRKDTTVVKRVINQTQSLIERFKPIIQGVWVEKDYVEKVIKTKSPLAAVQNIGDITTMYINTDNINGDSLIVPCGDNHEGSEITIVFQQGSAPSTIKTKEGGEIGYTIEKDDTILFYKKLNDLTKKIEKLEFIKALNKQPTDDLGYGMMYLINKGLFAGKYNLTDSIGKISQVDFGKHGEISGFSDFAKYDVNVDLNEEPMDNLDEITFFKSSQKNYSSYSFKFNADTLSLYDTHPNADSTELVLGKRIYKLIKQK